MLVLLSHQPEPDFCEAASCVAACAGFFGKLVYFFEEYDVLSYAHGPWQNDN